MKRRTWFITTLNLAAGLYCSLAVLGAAFFTSPLRAYVAYGLAVPFAATVVVAALTIRIEGERDPLLVWLNTFAYTPIYLLIGLASLGEAIAEQQPGTLIWLGFAAGTALVSRGADLLVAKVMGGPAPRSTRSHSRRLSLSLGVSVAVVLGSVLTYAGIFAARSATDVPSNGSEPSASNDTQASIRFTNAADQVVDIYWKNPAAEEILYRSLRPDQFYDQGTYATHAWVVRGQRDQEILLTIISDGSVQTATVD